MPPEKVQEINAAREANVNAGLPAASGAGATIGSITQGAKQVQNSLNTISSETLAGSPKPLVIPTPAPEVSPVIGLAAKAQAGQDAYKEAEARIEKANAGVNEINKQKSGVLDYLKAGQEKIAGFFTEAEDSLASQVDPAQKELNDIRTKESETLVQYRAETDAIKARGDISAEAQQGLQFNLDDKYGRVLADLAIRKSAQVANVADLRQAIKDKLELQLAPIDREQKFYKDFLLENFDDLKQDEKDKLNLLISERDKVKAEIIAKENIAQSAYEAAIANGIRIPNVVMQEIQENPGQAYEILARNGISLQNPLEAEAKRLANEKARRELGPANSTTLVPQRDAQGNVITDEAGNPVMVEAASDPFIQSLLDTKGGKALTDTSIQKLDKGLTVLGQLGVLQTNIQGIKTGPISGAFRGKNPWDTNAQVIKKQLNAIVPNLARGVYGEVGVLTDNDIKTYSGTIPNLTSTEAIRNAVLYITLDMIGKSIKNTLSVNAAAGRDVSGFVEIYTEMEASKNSILSTIPGAQVPQAFKKEGADNNDPLNLGGFESLNSDPLNISL